MSALPALQAPPGDAAAPARRAFDEVLTWLHSNQALAMTHSDVERQLTERSREALRLALQGWFDAQVPGRAQAPVVDAEGQERRPQPELHARNLDTTFGRVRVQRTGYGAQGKTSVHPLDGQLNLPAEVYSHELRRRVAREASQSSFEETRATLQEYTGTAIPKRQVEALAQRAAQDFDPFYQIRRQEAAGVEFPRFGGHSDTWVKEDVHMPKSHAPYPPEYRQQMVELVRAGRTPEELSQEFEPSAQAIRNWVQQAERDEGRREDGLPSAEREELGRLRRDNKQLRIEREILAKAAAWFARETDSIPSTSSSS